MWTDVMTGEFLGCLFLILFGGGVVANVVLADTKGNGSGWIVITTGWGFAVMIGVFVAVSTGSPQADLNPAVTLAKYLLGVHATLIDVARHVIAQMLGCFAGAVMVWLAYLPHWKRTGDAGLKRAVFCTDPAVECRLGNMLSEVIGTVVLIFGIGAIVGSGKISAGLLPYLVGMLVWAIGLSLGGATGYAINPARDLGPRIAHSLLPIHGKGASGWGYAWVPIAGPLAGALIAASMWNLLL
ncbi:aquaporin family protein [Cobetia marina]|jgi:glycerol uptake facilitator protein|uniref:MIP/aquaporin family protein n=1 Tax=Cobetia marina TaxID=28258 RepID=A0ABU9GJZ7_COBMA|nr:MULTISPECIES: MIP/aquaporin family protein [Cobetia]AOM00806.1 aquaporin [Cobetia marina]AZV30874.1 aquaporin family protein [Cobetia sp. ICG0124]MDA5562744.1 aquaporin family protein [Cobetia sp. MMG027]MDH2290880.1 aquaporin family protein [Cobetia sp. 10Alg 146]MDI6005101.1 MIP/aquaporin family protein [Cobetia pacifica]